MQSKAVTFTIDLEHIDLAAKDFEVAANLIRCTLESVRTEMETLIKTRRDQLLKGGIA